MGLAVGLSPHSCPLAPAQTKRHAHRTALPCGILRSALTLRSMIALNRKGACGCVNHGQTHQIAPRLSVVRRGDLGMAWCDFADYLPTCRGVKLVGSHVGLHNSLVYSEVSSVYGFTR